MTQKTFRSLIIFTILLSLWRLETPHDECITRRQGERKHLLGETATIVLGFPFAFPTHFSYDVRWKKQPVKLVGKIARHTLSPQQ